MRLFSAGVPNAVAGAFSPLDLPWAHAWWAEGPAYEALGYGADAEVSSWPDEIGTMDLAQATSANRPLHKTSVALLGNNPAPRGDGSNDTLTAAFPAAITQPFSVVAVAVVRNAWDNHAICGTVYYNNQNFAMVTCEGNRDLRIYAGSTINSAANLWAADRSALLVGYYNGASSEADLDDTTVASGAVGTGAPSAAAGDTFHAFSRGGGNYPYPREIAFLGIASGDIRSDPDWADFVAWSQTHYGTP